jgi:secondary thiamine-phosphate synthase enzyme
VLEVVVGYFTATVKTGQRSEIVDITPRVEELVKKSGVKSGICVLYVPHTTAAVSINENADPDVKRDVLAKLEKLIPQKESYYRHGEGNSDSHLKTSLTGPSVTILVEDGELVLGRWQGVYFCEFDGPRTREFFVKVMEG